MANVLYNPANETLLTFDQLAFLPTPEPMGSRHRPVPFYDYVQEVRQQVLNSTALTLSGEDYAVSKNNSRLFGVLELGSPASTDWRFLIGLRGSHDQSIGRGLVAGSRIMVCSNLCFSGDLLRFSTKQTTNVLHRLPDLIGHAVEQVPANIQVIQRREDIYRSTKIRERWGDALLVELYRRGALSGAQLAVAADEWHAPTFEAHAEDGHSVWRLYNACTQAIKPRGSNVNHVLVERRSRIAAETLDGLANAA